MKSYRRAPSLVFWFSDFIIHRKGGYAILLCFKSCKVLSSIDTYRRQFSHNMQSILRTKYLMNGQMEYRFLSPIRNYFRWAENTYHSIFNHQLDGRLYLVEERNGHILKEYSTALGIFEAMGLLDFEISGGDASQIYIYVNQEQALKNIISHPQTYHNTLQQFTAFKPLAHRPKPMLARP